MVGSSYPSLGEILDTDSDVIRSLEISKPWVLNKLNLLANRNCLVLITLTVNTLPLCKIFT